MDYKNKKCLIAYFSRKGNNYVNGKIIDLPVGNTELVANLIHEKVGSELFSIETVDSYPEDYTKTTEIAQNQLRNKSRPEITKTVSKMQDYDVIFLGYPNWWGTMPMAVWTFLESYDFSAKIIVPFCTHEGSGMGHSEQDIKKICTGAKVLAGLPLKGVYVQSATVAELKKDLCNWLDK